MDESFVQELRRGAGAVDDWERAHSVSDLLEQAAYAVERLERERDEALQEVEIWKSVFPDIAPDRVQRDRSLVEADLERVTKERDGAVAHKQALMQEADELWKVNETLKRERDEARALVEALLQDRWADGFRRAALATKPPAT